MTEDDADARLRKIAKDFDDSPVEYRTEVEKLYDQARSDLDQARQGSSTNDSYACENAVRIIEDRLEEMDKASGIIAAACGQAKAPSKKGKI